MMRRRGRVVARFVRNHAGCDLVGMVLGVAAWLIPTASGDDARALATATASLIAVLAAIVTFSLGFLFQSSNEAVVEQRRKLGKHMRTTWKWCVSIMLAASVAQLVAVAIAMTFPLAAMVTCWALMGLALAATWRALDVFACTVMVVDN